MNDFLTDICVVIESKERRSLLIGMHLREMTSRVPGKTNSGQDSDLDSDTLRLFH